MFHLLDSWQELRTLDVLLQVLQNHLSWQIRIFSLELVALMANATADVDEHRKFRIPFLRFFLYRVHVEPGGHPLIPHSHELPEMRERLRAFLGIPFKSPLVRLEHVLEDGLVGFGDVLVPDLGEILGHFLK